MISENWSNQGRINRQLHGNGRVSTLLRQRKRTQKVEELLENVFSILTISRL
jgi:hypothetical protein